MSIDSAVMYAVPLMVGRRAPPTTLTEPSNTVPTIARDGPLRGGQKAPFVQDLVRSCSAMIQPSRAGRRLPEAMLNPDALLRPKRLKPGDRVAALSLSWGGPGVFPHRFEAGVSQLRSEFGLEVVRTRNALLDPGWLAANPKARADDLMEAFADPSMAGIISSIGGVSALAELLTCTTCKEALVSAASESASRNPSMPGVMCTCIGVFAFAAMRNTASNSCRVAAGV